MKKLVPLVILATLVSWLVWSRVASPQPAPLPTAPLVAILQGDASANQNGNYMPVAGYNTVGVTVSLTTGTPSFTVNFEGAAYEGPTVSAPTGIFTPVQCFPANGSTLVTTATASGHWRCNVTGMSVFRARVSGYTGPGQVRAVGVAIVGGLVDNWPDSPFAQSLSLNNPLTVPNGGTGAATYPTSQFLQGNGTSPVTSSANPLLTSTGSTTARGLATRASEIVNVKDFGVVGDGVTDDRAAINTAISSGANRVLYFPDGTYVLGTTSGVLDDFGFDSALNIQVDNIRLVLSDNAILKYTGPTLVGGLGVNLLFVRGTKNVETTQTGSAVRATSFTVASAAGFTIGDDIAITNGTDANPTDFEINRISNISGTTITVAHPLENAYPNGTRVLDINWRRNVSVYGGQWNANSRGRTVIHAQYAQNSTVESIRARNTLADGRCIASTLYSTNNKWVRNYCEDIADRGIEEYTTTWNELIEANTVLRAGIHGIAVHGRHVRVIGNFTVGSSVAASGNAGIHLDTAHDIKVIGNHANQGNAHGFQTASDTVDAIFIGNEATANLGRGFDYATCTDCQSLDNVANRNGDDSYRFGAGITRMNSTADKSVSSAAFGFNVLAGSANTNLFGYLSQADVSGAFQDAGTNTKSSQFDASGFTLTGGGNTVFRAPAATSSTLQMAIGASNYAFYGVAGSAGAVVPGSVLGDTFLRTEAGKMLFSTNGGSTVGMTLGASGGGLQLGSPTGGAPAAGGANIALADGYLVNNVALKNIAETLSNKTIAAPVLSGTATGTYTLGGTPTLTAPAITGGVQVDAPTGGNKGNGTINLSATTPFFVNGNALHSTGTPTCGTGCATIVANSMDSWGAMTVTAQTSATVNWSHTLNRAPFCVVSDNSTTLNPDVTSTSTTTMVVGISGSLTGTIYWNCGGAG